MGIELERESYARGWERAMGTPAPELPGGWGAFSGAIAFGDVWNREQLTDRERRLIVLTVLALWGREDYLTLHLDASLGKGEFDAADVDDITVTLCTYAGMPVGSSFGAIAGRLLAQRAAAAADD